MRTMSKIGLETGQLTDEEIKYIDTAVVQTVEPLLIGRQIFPRATLPDAGFKTVQFYTETDMSAATISMLGETGARDRLELTAVPVNVPVISKDFIIHWRDVIAARHRGEPLDTAHIRNAARQVAEEEDKLLITGEYSGWKACGVKGLVTVANNLGTSASGKWDVASVIIADVKAAVAALSAVGHYGPYAMICTPSQYQCLKIPVGTGAEVSVYTWIMRDLFDNKGQIFQTPSLYAAAGTTDSALVVEPGAGNFDVAIGQDTTTYLFQDEDMNILGKVYEVLTPRIKRPAAIYEISSIDETT